MARKRKKLAIIVPYRDREEHLKALVPALEEHLDKTGINYQIWVVEQDDEQPWNKGRLLNAGFDLTKDKFDYFCFHDVDLLPMNEKCDYSYVKDITHISTYVQQYGFIKQEDVYGEISFIGGVVLFPKKDFIKINGYSNGYWGWGAEDSDLYFRCVQNGINIKTKPGKYHSQPHETSYEPLSYPELREEGESLYWDKVDNKEAYFNSPSYRNIMRLYNIKEKWKDQTGYGAEEGYSTIKYNIVDQQKMFDKHKHVNLNFSVIDRNLWLDFCKGG